MFARKVSIHLKPESLGQFTKTFENDVMPLLRKQKGFKDEITFATPGSRDVLAISLWDTKQNAEAYDATAYKEILTMLGTVTDGAPKVALTEVLHTTFSHEHANVSAA